MKPRRSRTRSGRDGTLVFLQPPLGMFSHPTPFMLADIPSVISDVLLGSLGAVVGAALSGGAKYGKMQGKIEELERMVFATQQLTTERRKELAEAIEATRSELREEIRSLRTEIRQDVRDTLRDTLKLSLLNPRNGIE